MTTFPLKTISIDNLCKKMIDNNINSFFRISYELK